MEFGKCLVLIFKLGLKSTGSKLMEAEAEEEEHINCRNLLLNDLARDSKFERNDAFADQEMAIAPNLVQNVSTTLEDDMYDVEEIVGMKKVDGRWLYKIRWKGYGKGSDTWEPQENLTQCLDMIEEFKLQQQKKRRKTRRATSINRNRSEALSISDETSSENAADGLPATETKTRNESQPDTFWKDLAEGRIPIRDEDMYSNVKGRRAKKNQNAQDSKTPSSHSSTSNDSTDRASANQDHTDFNLGVLQTLSHFFDNSLKAVDRLRKSEKDRAYRSCSKLSRDKHTSKKSSIMRVERVSCSPGKLMLKIKGHKVASSSYSSPLPNLLERKAHHNLRSKRISSTCTKNRALVQNEPTKVHINTPKILQEMSPVKSESDIPTTSNLLKELFKAVKAGNIQVVDGLFKLYKDHMGADKIKFGHVTHQLLLEALSSNNWEVMSSLLQNGASINSTSSDGTTILMAACQNANSEVVQKLLDRGAYKDKQNSLGMTALMIACSVGDSISVYKLLNSGANFVIVNRAGMSVLKLAKQAKNTKIQNILTKHVSRVKACFETEVRRAVFSNADIMHALFPLNCYTINEQSEVKISFDYKKELDTDCVSGDGYIIFIANSLISEREVSCKLDGVDRNCLVKSVILNEKKQELISLGTKVGYSCTPLHEGRNVLSVLMEQSNQSGVKLLICAYKVRLEKRS